MSLSYILEMEKDNRASLIKKKIVMHCIYNVTSTIPELSKVLKISIPTVAKIINEMCNEGILNNLGKIPKKEGRRPSMYGLNPFGGYFLGVDIKRDYINIGLSNFSGEIICQSFFVPCSFVDDSMKSLSEICKIISDFIVASQIPINKICNGCVNISGRVNPFSGYSYSRFNFADFPLSCIISEKIGIRICIDNDTRAMTYGELFQGCVNGEKNVLYVNLGWGLGLGIIINGVVYEGKSGFAGELGHMSVFDNEILCHCGKKGCLETEVSGMALHRQLIERVKAGQSSILTSQIENDYMSLSLSDIVDAINSEDMLCIELIEEIGRKLGKQIAGLINVFNPELVIIGGALSAAEEYLLHPIRLAIKKHSLNLVNNDSKIVCSNLHEKAGIIGACMIARNRLFEI